MWQTIEFVREKQSSTAKLRIEQAWMEGGSKDGERGGCLALRLRLDNNLFCWRLLAGWAVCGLD